MTGALQMSLMPSMRASDRHPRGETEALSLDLGDPPAKATADEGAKSDLAFRGERASRAERTARLSRILRMLTALDADWSRLKRLCRMIEDKTGRAPVERTVDGWLKGREPEPDGWEDLKRVFGDGLWTYVFYPRSEQAERWFADVLKRAAGRERR